jgi:hypothetical protein
MAKINYSKTPFPWFGGKSDAAEVVWSALGDVDHYVEPFAGSLAVLMRRPHLANRPYYSETVNDLDGLIVNAWRAMQLKPRETAEAASWPVTEVDLMARHIAIVRWRESNKLDQLLTDPAWCDPTMAGWWIWGQSCWIGSGWCSGTGPWYVDELGALCRHERKRSGDEPGVSRQLPHLGNDGQGANHPGVREPGVSRRLPHLVSDGNGANHAGVREPGVSTDVDDGRVFHPMTMPELLRWFEFLSARLRHVRIIQGDWSRALTPSASKTLSVRTGDGICGVFLDPPYSTEANRTMSIYTRDCGNVAHDVRAWCLANGEDKQYRIALAGYDTEHIELESHGWRVVEWFKTGFLKGGRGNTSTKGSQQNRERIWLSPHCIGETKIGQNIDMFGGL